eukprot:TRINITY_DN3789_c0_g1_i1.p1 TRINITY_DN3789_c0_g1~~TRINITY_DN3789_c0_g1_i1.p1  ORF type:complete len:171 (+),score=39.93 TRINITY_DN3789_c0_g1_i1:40-513(+)
MTGSAPGALNYYSIPAAGPSPQRTAFTSRAAAITLLVAAAALALLLTFGFPSGAPEAPSALYVTAGDVAHDVADLVRDVVAWPARSICWTGRQLRGAWRESLGAISTVGRKTRGAVRSIFRRGRDDVGSAADAVTGAAGRAARRVDDKFHDAVRKAE